MHPRPGGSLVASIRGAGLIRRAVRAAAILDIGFDVHPMRSSREGRPDGAVWWTMVDSLWPDNVQGTGEP
ncbi:MAG: hypothetical protein ACE5HD_03285 [Acidobacteriota bacterium]